MTTIFIAEYYTLLIGNEGKILFFCINLLVVVVIIDSDTNSIFIYVIQFFTSINAIVAQRQHVYYSCNCTDHSLTLSFYIYNDSHGYFEYMIGIYDLIILFCNFVNFVGFNGFKNKQIIYLGTIIKINLVSINFIY